MRKINKLIPSHLDIENIHGYCNAGCTMCAIKKSKSKPIIMANGVFEVVINRFLPYIDDIRNIAFVGIGEPLMDPGLVVKILYAASKGFKNICIPTNVSLLDEKKSQELLDSGLSEIIFSLDSLKKETFENIRRNLNFEKVMENAHRFIRMRDKGNYRTRIRIRIIEQEINFSERDDYVKYWNDYLNIDKGDLILQFPAHNWADAARIIPKNCECPYIFDRMVIGANGNIQFCCIDTEASFFNLGNVLTEDPVKLFNNDIFNKSRDLMRQGQINKIKPCSFCNVPLKRLDRSVLASHLA